MKTLQYLIDKYGDREMDEQEFKEFFKLVEPNVLFPKYGDRFWYMGERGHLTECIYDNTIRVDLIVINNHVFRTIKEAEFYGRKRKFLIQMERDFIANNDPIDWYNVEQTKWVMAFNYEYNKINIFNVWDEQVAGFYTTNQEWLVQYLKDNEADIKRYYFGVRSYDDERINCES